MKLIGILRLFKSELAINVVITITTVKTFLASVDFANGNVNKHLCNYLCSDPVNYAWGEYLVATDTLSRL